MRPSKRESILDTAERLFYEEGFHGTGVDRVVAEAGVARMTLYNHFSSKEALVRAVIERRQARFFSDIRQAVEARGAGSALDAVVAVHCRWLGTVARHGCMLIKAMGEYERHGADIHALAQRLKRDLLALVRDALALDGKPADEAPAERVLLVLEGANALLPVLGVERTVDHIRDMVPAVLTVEAA
jgi:AcrR family transcriptional regulator